MCIARKAGTNIRNNTLLFLQAPWDVARFAALRAGLRRKEEFLSALLRHG